MPFPKAKSLKFIDDRDPPDPVMVSALPTDETVEAVQGQARRAVLGGITTGLTILLGALQEGPESKASVRHLKQVGMLSKIGLHALRALGTYDFSEHRRGYRFAKTASSHTDAETVGAAIMTDGMKALAASQRANQIAALSTALRQIEGVPGMEESVQALRKEVQELASHPVGTVGEMGVMEEPADPDVTPAHFEEA